MSGLYESIDDIVSQINDMKRNRQQEFDDLQDSLIQLENDQHEIDLKVTNAKKILDFYGGASDNTHSLFSPIKNEEKKDVVYDQKQVEYEDLKSKLEELEEQFKIENDKKNMMVEKINSLSHISLEVANLKSVYQRIREDDFKNQILLDKREIYQKKRLMIQKKEKKDELVKQCNDVLIVKLEEVLESLKLILSFIDVDSNRAKIEIEKMNQLVQIIYGASKDMIDNVDLYEDELPFCEYLNKYVSEIKKIYKSVDIEAKGSNIISLNNIHTILNDNLCSIVRGMLNFILIKCDPSKIVFLITNDNRLSLKYCVYGKLVDFYSEMQHNPKSMLADVYEKIFLMHGKVKCVAKKDGFELEIILPIKYYL